MKCLPVLALLTLSACGQAPETPQATAQADVAGSKLVSTLDCTTSGNAGFPSIPYTLTYRREAYDDGSYVTTCTTTEPNAISQLDCHHSDDVKRFTFEIKSGASSWQPVDYVMDSSATWCVLK